LELTLFTLATAHLYSVKFGPCSLIPEEFGFDTLICVTRPFPKIRLIDLDWSCFDVSKRQCKAVRSGSRGGRSRLFI
jgi:hypothetical protein